MCIEDKRSVILFYCWPLLGAFSCASRILCMPPTCRAARAWAFRDFHCAAVGCTDSDTRRCATPLGQGNILAGLPRVHRGGRKQLSACTQPTLWGSEAWSCFFSSRQSNYFSQTLLVIRKLKDWQDTLTLGTLCARAHIYTHTG